MNFSLIFTKSIQLLFILTFFLYNNHFYSGDNPIDCIQFAELIVWNNYAEGVTIKVTPVGSIFSGKYTGEGKNEKYTFEPSRLNTNNPARWRYLIGGVATIPLKSDGTYSDCSKGFKVFDFDDGGNYDPTGNLDKVAGVISYGLWKMEYFYEPQNEDDPPQVYEYCYIDLRDWNYGHAPQNSCHSTLGIDIALDLRSNGKIYFYFYGDGTWQALDNHPQIQNRTLKHWERVGTGHAFCIPHKGDFKTTSFDNGRYLNWPLKANDGFHGGHGHIDFNRIDMNLSIVNNMTANILSGNTVYIDNNSKLKVTSNCTLNVNSGSTLIVTKNSALCNYGGRINKSGTIIFQGVSRCDDNQDFVIGDSTQVILEDSASWELEANSIVTLQGSKTALIMKPGSQMKFGTNAKLIIKDGARIKADSCVFISLDPDSTWNGIYLEDIAYDTLKNCVIQNAVNGINIADKIQSSFSDPTPAAEISNCTFKNSTSTALLNLVYINNSTNVLIKGCSSVKTGSAGFTSGIIAEYCPTGGIVITDNNINYVTTGISLLQSSEYIARNTITGAANSGTGIYLDNSNGTIEYNIINNFQKSVYGSYSSPYMLKNTLSGASSKNIELVSNSLPVMKPVVSGSTLRWLGGNNTITGTPSHSGINFTDCYPLMDSGYNKVTVNGADYMNGVFTQANTTVYARINYWYDSPPNSSLFDITYGSVNYDNPFDGSTLPLTDGTELNSIGWGMYDTVFTKSLGDNPTAEDLFMQAYTHEMNGNYTDAVADYKEVVSSYKTSSYAPVSLSRIFNCLEKSNASSSQYQAIQSYYTGIKNNNTHPYESRELAEDYVIKSKVKQGLTEEALSDYVSIYQNNQNNSKGQHALLNKLCLENMIQGDNPNTNQSYESHKINLLSLITGEEIRLSGITNNIAPVQFRLHQNYPNPFNPKTTITYNIGKSGNVKIEVYDILGRLIKLIVNEYKETGHHFVEFDASNFASGLYLYRITSGEFIETKKMLLVK